jgi:preprotein translocase subunit SecA
VIDLTRNIQRKKDRELAELQLTSATGTTEHTQASNAGKVGRNDPCPCGSGKKYKKCHGANS